MEEQKFKIGEEVYIMCDNRPIKVRIVDYKDNYHDPRLSEDRNIYTVYNSKNGMLNRIFEGRGIYRSKIEAYIEMIRENLIEGDDLSITVDDEFYTIKIKKGE